MKLKYMSCEKTYKSTCSYCGVGCGVEVKLPPRGLLEVTGDASHTVNEGRLCSKGRNLHHVVNDQRDRLLYPEMRGSRHHPMRRVSWETAIHRAASVFKTLISKFGPDSVGFYVSGQLLTEEYYLANKIMKGFIGSNNIDTNSRLCMSSAVAGYKQVLGDDIVPGCYEDLDLCDCFLIAGANPAWCHPILFQRIQKRKDTHPETKIIVVDPRRTQSCASADLHLQLNPGTDVVLFNAIAGYFIEHGLVDEHFIQNHTNGYVKLEQHLSGCSVDEAARICGIKASDIKLAAQWMGTAKGFMTLWAMGLNQSAHGVDKNKALLNLSLLTGQIGKPGAGPFSLTGQPNAMGGREVGGLANLLAAHRDLGSLKEREYVQSFWDSGPISPSPGRTATEMFDALASGEMRAIWIMCTNPAVTLPNLRSVEEGLKNARFVVVQDISNKSDTLEYADLILPAAGWLEKEGTVTNSERRVSYVPKLTEPPGEALPDVEILWRFAQAMGWEKQFTYKDSSEIYTEHVRLTVGTPIDIGGLSHERLKNEGPIQWPCPESSHPGTARIFEDHKFQTADGRASLSIIQDQRSENISSNEFPFVLTTGRIRDQWHTMTRTGKVKKLGRHKSTPFVEVHLEDGKHENIRHGETIRIRSDQGSLDATVELTDSVKRGVVFVPMHWTKSVFGCKSRANNVTSTRIDPVSKTPDFKYTAVALDKIEQPKKRILVVGAGAAALQFVTRYRALNQNDEIHVFSRELDAFYNRILLPEYLNGALEWDALSSTNTAQITSLGVYLHTNNRIDRIDREKKRILDGKNNWHEYDKLVLATGSSAAVPSPEHKKMKGVFTLRNRANADTIRDSLHTSQNVIIVGGGLLGIELAGAISELGINCTILHRSSALMRSQLDAVASDILREELEDRGVTIRLNDSILHCHGQKNIESVRTRSGNLLPCDTLIFAVGIRPNIGIGVEAGLSSRSGLLVDGAMRTSDPDIYAIGEIAEVNNTLYGTTPAAQAQANTAAEHLAGNPWKIYEGSIPFNVLKLHGFNLCSIGVAQTPKDLNGFEEIALLDRSQHYYKKCILQNGKMIGATLIGDLTELQEFKRLIEEEEELDEKRTALLRGLPQQKTEAPEGKIVCSCLNVGQGNIEKAILTGCRKLESICDATRAGTGCGSCIPEIKTIIEKMEKDNKEDSECKENDIVDKSCVQVG